MLLTSLTSKVVLCENRNIFIISFIKGEEGNALLLIIDIIDSINLCGYDKS